MWVISHTNPIHWLLRAYLIIISLPWWFWIFTVNINHLTLTCISLYSMLLNLVCYCRQHVSYTFEWVNFNFVAVPNGFYCFMLFHVSDYDGSFSVQMCLAKSMKNMFKWLLTVMMSGKRKKKIRYPTTNVASITVTAATTAADASC